MKKTIKVSRPSNGQHTVVTVTILEDGITVAYAYRSSATKIGDSIRFCTERCVDMLAQARAEIDRDSEVAA